MSRSRGLGIAPSQLCSVLYCPALLVNKYSSILPGCFDQKLGITWYFSLSSSSRFHKTLVILSSQCLLKLILYHCHWYTTSGLGETPKALFMKLFFLLFLSRQQPIPCKQESTCAMSHVVPHLSMGERPYPGHGCGPQHLSGPVCLSLLSPVSLLKSNFPAAVGSVLLPFEFCAC